PAQSGQDLAVRSESPAPPATADQAAVDPEPADPETSQAEASEAEREAEGPADDTATLSEPRAAPVADSKPEPSVVEAPEVARREPAPEASRAAEPVAEALQTTGAASQEATSTRTEPKREAVQAEPPKAVSTRAGATQAPAPAKSKVEAETSKPSLVQQQAAVEQAATPQPSKPDEAPQAAPPQAQPPSESAARTTAAKAVEERPAQPAIAALEPARIEPARTEPAPSARERSVEAVTEPASSEAAETQREPTPVEAESEPEPAPIQVEQRAALTTPSGEASATPAERTPPSFDVVRVEPNGDTVIAGRAEPGSEVTVMDGDREIGSVTADSAGQWVAIIDRPLAPGSHQLGLRADATDGVSVESTDVVIVAIPSPPSPEASGEPAEATAESDATPLAVLAPRQGQAPSEVLQLPEDEGLSDQALVLSAVDYDASGRVVISGRSEAEGRVMVYLDNELLGQTMADPEGRWVLSPESEVETGLHQLRVDQVSERGSVLARVETPFSRAALLINLPEERFVVVQPGNSLWRIARRSYGEGLRYSVIFQSNRDQIRDPDLIYPGQIFLMPDIN
ncbi:MAG: Ig-like domain-containing protein, partial [Kiloniellales bacterium]|nr:Ig-like domain-containing protein [Kiloniellales bacterium]